VVSFTKLWRSSVKVDNPGRTFATNVPDITQDGISWREFVERQNPDIHTPPEPDPRFGPYSLPSNTTHTRVHPSPSTLPSVDPTRCHSRSSSPHSDSLPQEDSTAESYHADLELAFDLLEQLMQPESTRRITPRGALYHPFLDHDPEDDEFFPHPFGEGVCGEGHFIDEVTEEPCVKVRTGGETYEVKRLVAGEGIAIGMHPCEYHRSEYGYQLNT
jgi:cell division control protein 7